MLAARPSNSVSLRRYWDWRFRFHLVKKQVLANLTVAVCCNPTQILTGMEIPFLFSKELTAALLHKKIVRLLTQAWCMLDRDHKKHFV